MPRVSVVQAHAVDKHQHLVECAATHADIRLRPVGSTGTDIDTRQILKNIRNGLDGQRLDVLVGNLRDESVGTRLNFSFVRYNRHLLKTKLSGIMDLRRLRREHTLVLRSGDTEQWGRTRVRLVGLCKCRCRQ